MRIPVKITPDRIRDSIVQVFFQSPVPFEALVGIFYLALVKSDWKYTNSPNQNAPSKGLLIEFTNNTQHFFLKDPVRFQLHNSHSIIFNCNKNYIGWSQYGIFIQDVLNRIFNTGEVTSFSRIGIRYISEFPDIDILDKIKFKVTFPNDEKLTNSSHRLVFDEGGVIKTINIASKIPNIKNVVNQTDKTSYISMLDIDIVQKDISITSTQELWHEIDRIHTIEKEAFFGFLLDGFIESLKPEYS